MILNTYLKSENLKLNKYQKMKLGLNLISSFRARFNNQPKKVSISVKGVKMEVFDYPREFFNDERTIEIVKRFVNKRNKKNEKL